jgi:DNA replication protein
VQPGIRMMPDCIHNDMATFSGFPEGKARLIPIPEAFFRQVLLEIDDLAELKLTVHIFWRLDQMEGAFRYLHLAELVQDQALLAGFGSDAEQSRQALGDALEQAVLRGVLLRADWQSTSGTETLYFLNSPKGRAALQAIQEGKWKPVLSTPVVEPPPEAPNIFRLYEENIGPLTPMIAETLGEAEDTYPAAWIAEAIGIAVKNNKRTWRYIGAILERWQREGKDGRKEKQDRPDSAESRRKYIEGDYSEFVKH